MVSTLSCCFNFILESAYVGSGSMSSPELLLCQIWLVNYLVGIFLTFGVKEAKPTILIEMNKIFFAFDIF